MAASEPITRCLVVTPTFDSEAYLDETIASVVMQVAPGVALDYHIQDGGSRDGTAAIAAAWIERIEKRVIPIQLHSLRMTFESLPDKGMYDAINRGFAHLRPGGRDIVTWINSDDRLAPGAVATIQRVWLDNPGCDFVSGRTALINADGALVSINSPQAYPRATLAAGLHDGRSLPFIMQEGTFFSGALWETVGGVRSTFRLAGDWDLWRRMAREAVHFSVDTITAFHRRRPGQLSSDIALYHAEVDALAPEAEDGAGDLDSEAQLIRYDPDTDRWVRAPFDPFASRPPIAILDGRRRAALAVTYAHGFGAPEGPYPEFRLPAGIRWLKEDWAEIGVHAPDEGMVRVRLVVRPTETDLPIRAHLNGMEIFAGRLGDPVPDTDQLVEFAGWLSIGRNTLDLELAAADDRPRRLLLVSCAIIVEPDVSDADRADQPIASETHRALGGLAVVVDAGESPTGAVATLASLREIAGAGLFVRAEPDGDAALAVRAYAPDAEHGAEGPPLARLAAAGYTCVLTVAGGDRVDRSALIRAIEMRAASGGGAVVGLTDLIDSAGVTHRRLLPGDGGAVRLSSIEADGSCDARVIAPFPLASRLAERVRDDDAASVTIWVLDDALAPEISPLYALAGALRMLGIDARYVGARGMAPRAYRPLASHLILTAAGLADGGSSVVRVAGERMTIEGDDATSPSLPLGIDTTLFRPRPRAAARAALDLGADDALVIVDAEHVSALEADLAALGARSITVLVLGRPDGSDTRFRTLSWPDDPEILSQILSAANAVLVPGPECGALGRAACACGVPVVDPRGSILTPEGAEAPAARGLLAILRRIASNRPLARRIGARARDAVMRSAGVEAVAVALHGAASALAPGPLADALSARTWLSAGEIELPTSTAPMLGGGGVVHHRDFALRVLSGAVAGSDPVWPEAILFRDVTVVLLLRASAKVRGATLRLHLAGPAGATWSARVDDGRATTFAIGAGAVTTVRLAATLVRGLHRVELTAANPLAYQRIAETRLLAWEVVATGIAAQAETTATRLVPVPLAGRQVATLSRDGDWRPLENFLKPEGPHPLGGLFATFRWSTGRTASLVLRVEQGGPREIDFAITGLISGQKLRIMVGDSVSDWGSPLEAYVGRVTHRSWTVDWPEGDVTVTLELEAPSSVPNPRELGVLILGVELR